MQLLNDPQTPRPASEMLEEFLKTSTLQRRAHADNSPWDAQTRLQSANKKYQAAARLFDSGRKEEAIRKLAELLKEQPDYPFAVMLSELPQNRLQEVSGKMWPEIRRFNDLHSWDRSSTGLP
jgi:tetratricopeptide (TPR) repeat protein